MATLREVLKSGRVILMDGAMGTELLRAGLTPGQPGERWNLTFPERVLAIHQAYRQAGAECLLTNTFQASPKTLGDDLERANEAAIQLARSAAGPDGLVLADLGPMEFEDAYVRCVLKSLRAADGLLLETCSDVQMLEGILRQTDIITDWPVLFSLTYRKDNEGRIVTHPGQSPEEMARLASALPIAALGVNCGREIDLQDIVAVIQTYRQNTDLPLFARPNAGTPLCRGDQWIYPRTPQMFADALEPLMQAGLNMIGGCCGTTPQHIAAMNLNLDLIALHQFFLELAGASQHRSTLPR